MRLFWICSILCFLIGLFLSVAIIRSSEIYQDTKIAYANDLNYRNRLLDPDEWLSPEKTESKLLKIEEAATRFQAEKKRINRLGFYFLLLVMAYLVAFILLFRKIKAPRILVLGFIFLALLCLPIGLLAPMLEIGAYEQDLDLGNIPINAKVMSFKVTVEVNQQFPGALYFYYQSKSVIELIGLLFQQKNLVVGLSILLFSVLFPLIKILATLSLVYAPKLSEKTWLSFIVEKLGKWSMADVFVVAVFLAFLAFSNMQVGVTTDSNILIGLYFFLGYCIFSIFSSYWVEKM